MIGGQVKRSPVHHHAALDHHIYMGRVPDVLRGIGAEQDDVGELPLLDRAEVAVPAEEGRRVQRADPDRVDR